jgi:sporulation protein YlmC with PRC-barrel domain
MTLTVAGAQEQQASQAAKDQMNDERMRSSLLGHAISAHKLLGDDIFNNAGQELGSVENLVFDRDQQRVMYVIMVSGEVLGLGGKKMAVPWQEFSFGENDRIMVDFAKVKIEDAPTIATIEEARYDDPEFHKRIYTFYGTRPYALDDTAAYRDLENYDWAPFAVRADNMKWACPLNKIIGAKVTNPEDEGIGEVKDLILDADEGHATFALVGFGGVLGFFSDTAAVPWSALEFDAEEEEYALNTTQGVLDTAKIDADDYKRLENEEFSRSIHTAFKTEPYWVIHGYVSPEADDTRTTAPSPQASTGVGAKPMTLMGTVQNVETYDVAPAGEKMVRFTMRTPAGDDKTIVLASPARLDELKLKLNEGQQVTVSGYEKKMADGMMAFQATDVTVDGKKCVLEKPIADVR